MKKILIQTLILTVFSAFAEPLYIRFPNVHDAAKAALKANELKKGDTAFAAVINAKKYPGVWGFWSIKNGDTPEAFELLLMKFAPSGVGKGMMRSNKLGCFSDLNFGWLRNRGEGYGMAFSFRNPSKGDLDLELDGSLRLYSFDPAKPFHLFVFTRDAAGKTKVISTSADEDAIMSVQEKKHTRYYFRLSADVKLAPGARVYIALCDKTIATLDRRKTKMVFCLNEGWRKPALVPCFILRSRIKE